MLSVVSDTGWPPLNWNASSDSSAMFCGRCAGACFGCVLQVRVSCFGRRLSQGCAESAESAERRARIMHPRRPRRTRLRQKLPEICSTIRAV